MNKLCNDFISNYRFLNKNMNEYLILGKILLYNLNQGDNTKKSNINILK